MSSARNLRFNEEDMTWHADHIEKTTQNERDFMAEWNFKVAPILRDLKK